MSSPDDYVDDMQNESLTDEAIEAFFLGLADPAWEREPSLAALAEDMAFVVSGPAPVADHALLQLFWGTPAPAEPTRPLDLAGEVAGGHRRAPVGVFRRRVRLIAGAAVGTGMALLSVGVAGATGVLPDPAQRVVAQVVEAISPFELPHPGGSPGGGAATTGGTGVTGVTGVPVPTIGQQPDVSVPPASPDGGRGVPPVSPPTAGDPAAPASSGLDRAGETPAGQSIPPFVPDAATPEDPPAANSGVAPRGPATANETPAPTTPASVPRPPAEASPPGRPG